MLQTLLTDLWTSSSGPREENICCSLTHICTRTSYVVCMGPYIMCGYCGAAQSYMQRPRVSVTQKLTQGNVRPHPEFLEGIHPVVDLKLLPSFFPASNQRPERGYRVSPKVVPVCHVPAGRSSRCGAGRDFLVARTASLASAV